MPKLDINLSLSPKQLALVADALDMLHDLNADYAHADPKDAARMRADLKEIDALRSVLR